METLGNLVYCGMPHTLKETSRTGFIYFHNMVIDKFYVLLEEEE
jgi:hypothetical protein